MEGLNRYPVPVNQTATKPVDIYSGIEERIKEIAFNTGVAGMLIENEYGEINVSYNTVEKLLQVLEIPDETKTGKISIRQSEYRTEKTKAVKKLVDEMNYFLKDMGYQAFLNERNLHEIIIDKILWDLSRTKILQKLVTWMSKLDSSTSITQEPIDNDAIIEIVGPNGSSREKPVESFLLGQFFFIKQIYKDYLTEKSPLHNGVKISENVNESILIEIDNEYSITIEENGFSILEHDTSILTLYTQNEEPYPIIWEVKVNGIPTKITPIHRETLKRLTKDLCYRLAKNSIS